MNITYEHHVNLFLFSLHQVGEWHNLLFPDLPLFGGQGPAGRAMGYVRNYCNSNLVANVLLLPHCIGVVHQPLSLFFTIQTQLLLRWLLTSCSSSSSTKWKQRCNGSILYPWSDVCM